MGTGYQTYQLLTQSLMLEHITKQTAASYSSLLLPIKCIVKISPEFFLTQVDEELFHVAVVRSVRELQRSTMLEIM